MTGTVKCIFVYSHSVKHCCADGEPISIKNPIASFFNMLHAFTSYCRMNQDSLTADDSLSVIGALLQKVSTQTFSFLATFSIVLCVLVTSERMYLIAAVVREI